MICAARRSVLIAAAVAGVLLAAALPAHAEEKTSWQFDFAGQAASGAISVKPTATYSKDAGYGFEEAPDGKVVSGAGDATADGALVAAKPFYFSAAVPEGNYKVTAVLGDPDAASDTTIKAELRRLMIEHVHTDAGKYQTVSFVVNVRRPDIPGGGEVKLKAPRETTAEAWDWDDKLTLEFNNAHPALASLSIEKVDVPTIYLLGDSTMCDQPAEPWCSWGQMLPVFFKPDIAVANHAESGETIADSNSRGRFKKILAQIKPGDYFITQFGHNDMKERGADASEKYKADLTEWVKQIKAKGATPIVVTPMNRHTFRDGKVYNSLADYPDKVREVAKEQDCTLIDLNDMSATLYDALGEEGSNQLFEHETDAGKHDGTHHSPYGAYELASCILQGIRQNVPDLARHIRDDVPAFDPAHPNPASEKAFDVPPSPKHTNVVPLGS
ncbi:MAG TPA: rhamnogalacturonan acetylesterase [Phycisphaerae bacterium]|nr:rhamnogalacturonan acetylesterase [Phycisphaerae bacterium]